MVAAGYGMGALLTTFPIDSMIKSSGYRATLTTFGIILGFVGLAAALGLRAPLAAEVTAKPAQVLASGRDTEPSAMLKTPIFRLMFAMVTMMSTGGLMVTSNFANFAKEFGVADLAVAGMAAVPLALTVDRILNGLTRPFFGWLSDRIGRENIMGLAFLLEALAITLMLAFRFNALAFVVLSGLVFFGWGEIFSLFPSTLTDTFGTRNATTNYGFLYMAQGSARCSAGRWRQACTIRPAAGSRCSAWRSRWTSSSRCSRCSCRRRCGAGCSGLGKPAVAV